MSPTLQSNARRLVQLAEGFSSKPYICPAGYLTIGYGHNLDAAPLTITLDKPLADGITKTQADEQLTHDMNVAWVELVKHLPWITQLDDVRQFVLWDMNFNMGWTTFKQFKATLRFAKAKDFTHCAEQMKRSKWYRQTGNRARRNVRMMLTGEWPTLA